MPLPSTVNIVEVGPRDGLQNEPTAVKTSTKLRLIELLVSSGLTHIEAGSFVNPRWVPQMAGSDEVFNHLPKKTGITYSALTPNMQGFERAMAAGAQEVAIFAAASETFSQKNINCSIGESLKRFEPLMEAAHSKDIPVRGYISCVAGCPYEGRVSETTVQHIAHTLYTMGCYEISLGDTTGVGTVNCVQSVIEHTAATVPLEKIAVHFHNTYGQALVNTHAALCMGVSTVDAAVAGLGGCPYSPGAAGNLATEDLVYLLNGLGIAHGVDLAALCDAGKFICNTLGISPSSNVSHAMHAILATR